MEQYKEIRTMNILDLRRVCIEYNLFTRGTNEEYEKFLTMADVENITTNDLVNMAKEIEKHSVIMDGVYTEDIMYILNRATRTIFSKV